MDKRKGKKHKVVLKAVKLTDDNNQYNFYTCDPTDNNEHMFIGFLSRGNNPSNLCMPCCFKKDQLSSGNKKKENYANVKCNFSSHKNDNLFTR